jgi:hypothetical protein
VPHKLKFILAVAFLFLTERSYSALSDSATDQVQQQSQAKNQTSNQSQKEEAKTSAPVPLAEKKFQKEAQIKSPSFQQKKWTGTQGAYETNIEYDYVAPASSNEGQGVNHNFNENYLDIRHQMMRHTLLAFLVQGGFEYQHMGFDVPNYALVPDRLDSLVGIVGIDFRWSEKDLLHLEGRPGFYTDWRGASSDAFNTPLDIGYTRVVSPRFQWIVGGSLNTWRGSRLLGAAGFRWQATNRWQIKCYLPQPDIEYKARTDLTLTVGADFRGDTYRVGPHFGDTKGAPALNSALVDYQEIRIGPGFSWNVRPLIEINFMAGYMTGRQYDFHNNGPKLNGSGAPFVNLAVHALFKLPGDNLAIPQRTDVSIHNIFNFL